MAFKSVERRREYFREYLSARWKRLRAEWFAGNGPCVECGSWSDLELDHEDRTKKVSHKVWFWSPERRAVELAKCKPRCKKCHKKKTILESMTQTKHRPVGKFWRPSRCKCTKCRPDLYVVGPPARSRDL